MSRRLAPLTLDTLGDLPDRCRSCVFWELDPVAAERAVAAGDPGFDKEAWLSSALLEWGSCGRVAYVDDVPAGYVVYAPPAFVPRSLAFPTSPASGDAVLLMTGHVVPRFRGGGLGRMLVQGAAKDLTRRGVRAIEAFGLAQGARGEGARGEGARGERSRDAGGPSGSGGGHLIASGCVVPADFLLSVGFKTVRPHHRYPRLRLDLKTALSWREDVEMALERILGSVRAPVLTPR
jgi:GNAT superfamily N-acetyltransferase